MSDQMDCGDNSCIFAEHKGGMRTNGGCRCLQDIADRDLRRRLYSHVSRLNHRLRTEEHRARGTAEEEREDVLADISKRAGEFAKMRSVKAAETAYLLCTMRCEYERGKHRKAKP